MRATRPRTAPLRALALATLLGWGRPAAAMQAFVDDAASFEAAALAAGAPRGIDQTLGFEAPVVSTGQVLTTQYAADGVTFAGTRPVRIVDNVEESWPRDLQAAGIDFGAGVSEIRISFDADPQQALSLYLLDVNSLTIEGLAGGAVVESGQVVLSAEDLPAGRLVGLVFDGQVDEILLRSDMESDGFGLDDLTFAEPGTIDNDGDGQTDVEGDCDDLDASIEGLDLDGDGVSSCDGDCDDTNPGVQPGVEEACNGWDDDCDGATDEGFDEDFDGYTTCAGDCDDTRASTRPNATETCNGRDDDCDGAVDEGYDADGDGYTTCAGDCDDLDRARSPGETEVCDGVDQDCDGLLDEGYDADGDGYTTCAGDCDDGRSGVRPGAAEGCDGVDNDCDGLVDEGFDVDVDGYTSCGGDCDDADPDRNPGEAERCDGIDQNCDGISDDGLDLDGDGSTPCAGDCDDGDPGVYTGSPERCDGVDQDCDGAVDDGLDLDGDGLTPCAGDCDDSDPRVGSAAAETCDGIDDDCDGLVDEGFDSDFDGWPWCGGDCDDGNPLRHPGAAELCDGVDQDCDGAVDEGFDVDGDGVRTCDGDCDDGRADVHPGAEESCDGVDQDCDGGVDEGWDADGDGVASCFDCDDADPYTFPGAPEDCDGWDDDCDGLVDEDFDQDSDGFSTCGGDCDDADHGVNPNVTDTCGDGVDDDCDGTVDNGQPEACDGLDNDCDGAVDEGFDADGDGYPSCEDCDDADPAVHPGAEEQCDGADGDCDGTVPSDESDTDGDGLAPCEGDCDDTTLAAGDPDLIEVCDGVDNDCDGAVDDDCLDPEVLGMTAELRGGGCLCAGAGPGRARGGAARGGAAAALPLLLIALGRRTRSRRRGAAWSRIAVAAPTVFTLALLSAGPASADPGAEGAALPSERLETPIDGGPFVSAEGSEVLEPLHLRTGLTLHYSHAPLVLWHPATGEEQGVVEHRIAADLVAGVGLSRFASFGVRLPFAAWQSGVDPVSGEESPASGLGDLVLAGKIRVVDPRRAPLGLALSLPLSLPTGNKAAWLGESGPSFAPMLVADRRVGRFLFAGGLGARLRGSEEVGTIQLGPEFLFRAGAAVTMGRGTSLATEVSGATGGATDNSPLEWSTSFSFAHPGGFQFATGAGLGVLPGYGTPDVRVFARAAWEIRLKRQAEAHAEAPAPPAAPVVREVVLTDLTAPAAEPPPFAAMQRERRLMLEGAIQFAYGRAALEERFRGPLLALASYLHAHPDIVRIRIEGHADHRGGDDYNLDLSRRRAQAVQAFLQADGRIEAGRVEAVGYGERRPRATNATDEGMTLNRRVEFYVTMRQDLEVRASAVPIPTPAITTPPARTASDHGGLGD